MHTGNKPNLLDLDRKGLEGFFLDRGEKVFRASQVMKWIYERGVTDFADMTNLSKGLRTGLRDSASIRLPDVVADQEIDALRHRVFEDHDTKERTVIMIKDYVVHDIITTNYQHSNK